LSSYAWLLALLVLVGLFVAYEEAGLRLKGWHTISWYAQHRRSVFVVILVAFLLGGGIGAVWWTRHIFGQQILK